MTLEIACIQINSGNDMAANMVKVEALVKEAVGKGARLVALPENVFLMEEPGAGKRNLYALDEHPAVVAASHMAKAGRCWLLVGSVAIKIDNSGKSVNRSILFDPEGEISAHYDKIHLFDVELPSGEVYAESARMLSGEKAVLSELPECKLGMTVCYDVRFPHLYRVLAQEGAEVIAVPSAFTQITGEAHWHVLLRARAIENACFIIAPAQTGTHPGGRKTYGHALIVDPWGRVLADAGTAEGIIAAELDLDLVKQTRVKLPSLMHDREFTT